jgi:chromate reductase, NAD(P)H dehydrogenase (quinone)
VLTTALDWCLRRSSPFRHKPVGIAGASPSGAGTVLGQMVLRQILLHGPAYVMPEPRMLISNAYQRFEYHDAMRHYIEEAALLPVLCC